MDIIQLNEAISNLEESISDSLSIDKWKVNRDVLQSVCNNYKELLAYKQNPIANLPCKVGDVLYRISVDEFIEAIDVVEHYVVDNIVICEDDILFKYDAYDGVICTLKSIQNHEPYLDMFRVFLDENKAKAELEAAFIRKGYKK